MSLQVARHIDTSVCRMWHDTVITEEDLLTTSNQLEDSMGKAFTMILIFSIVIFSDGLPAGEAGNRAKCVCDFHA